MRVLSIRFTIVGLAILAIGCTDGIDQPSAPDVPQFSKQASTAPDQQVARAFALALKDRDVRSVLLQSLRASPLTEHKLVLQDFVATPSGQQLISFAAGAIGVRPATLTGMISALPPLDMYVPSRAQRRSWHATNGAMMVAAMLGNDLSTIVGYNPGGQVVSEAAKFVDHGPLLLLLQRAEPKGRRINAQPNVAGVSYS